MLTMEVVGRHLSCPYYPYYCSCSVPGARSDLHCPLKDCPSCLGYLEQEGVDLFQTAEPQASPSPEAELSSESEIEDGGEGCSCQPCEGQQGGWSLEEKSDGGSAEAAGFESYEHLEESPQHIEELDNGHMEELAGSRPVSGFEISVCPCRQQQGGVEQGEEEPGGGCGLAVEGGGGRCCRGRPPCSLFPGGGPPCPPSGLCDCRFPVPPCLAPPICPCAPPARPQYCFKENCCMGLPQPPLMRSSDQGSGESAWYSYRETKPGSEQTKYFVEISDRPPEFPLPGERAKPRWEIVRGGEAHLRCKTVRELVARKGPCTTRLVQYSPKDVEVDPLTKAALASKKNEMAKLKVVIASLAKP